jgi:hypothetical protein
MLKQGSTIMVDINSTENNMVQIPKQSWYELVIFELTPEQLHGFFGCANLSITDLEPMVELTETGLDYISDRFKEGSHDMLDTSSVPDTQRLKNIADKLEKWRKEYIIASCDFETNGEAIEDYLNDNYIREDK